MSSATTPGATSGAGTTSVASIPDHDDPEYLSTVNDLYQSAVQSMDAQALKSLLQNPKSKQCFDDQMDEDRSFSEFHYTETLAVADRCYYPPEQAKKLGQWDPNLSDKGVFYQRKSATLAVMLSEWERQIKAASSSLLMEHFKNSDDCEEELFISEQIWKHCNDKYNLVSNQDGLSNLFETMKSTATVFKLPWIKARKSNTTACNPLFSGI